MKIKKSSKTMITIFTLVILFVSCETRKHTTQKVFVGNQSTKDIIVEFNGLDSPDTIFADCSSNKERRCNTTLISNSFMDKIEPEFTEDEFEQMISSLQVYFYDSENRKVDYGGSSEFCKKFINWEYHYSEDSGYGLHEYKLVAVD